MNASLGKGHMISISKCLYMFTLQDKVMDPSVNILSLDSHHRMRNNFQCISYSEECTTDSHRRDVSWNHSGTK